jgi:ssDNA-binding replication factor A large subunit
MGAYDLVSDIMSRDEFEGYLKKIREELYGLIDREASELLLLDEVGRLEMGSDIEGMEAGESYTVTLIVDAIQPVQSFKRSDGEGRVASIRGFDGDSDLRVVFWDDQTDQLDGVKKGDLIRIINGVVRQGRRRKEIHISRASTIEKVGEVKFETKPIGALNPPERESVKGTITEIKPVRSFKKGDRDIRLRKIGLKDETGRVDVALWNERADEFEELGLKEGDEIYIIGGFVKNYSNGVEISCDWRGRLIGLKG